MDLTRLFTKYARAVQLVRTDDPNSPDPNKPWRQSAGIVTTQDLVAVVTKPNEQYAKNEFVEEGDQLCYVNALDVTNGVQLSDSFVIDDVHWRVVKITKLELKGTVLAYRVQVRR